MKKENKRRMGLGVGYIGSGNKSSVFSRKSKPVFEKIKSIYGEKLERLVSKKSKQKANFKQITAADRLKIRQQVRMQLKQERVKDITLIIISFLIVFSVIFLLLYYFSK